jgi:hypothetical protein
MSRMPGNNTKESVEARKKKIKEILSKEKDITNVAIAERVGCGLDMVRKIRGKQ